MPMVTFSLLAFCLILLLQLQFSTVTAQINATIRVGESLTAGSDDSPWLSSPSQDFAFGFQKLGENSFLLSIWYHKLQGPQAATVWCANGDKPAPRNSILNLTADGGLVLKDSQGSQLWSSGKSSSSAQVAYAVMNDTGNFVLMDRNSKPIWESFDHPTDTLLPTQVLKLGGSLSSRKSSTSFSRGRFEFHFNENGSAVLTTPFGKYQDVYAPNQSNPVEQVIFDQSGYLYVLLRNGERSDIIIPEDRVKASNPYQRVTLNFNGVLASTYHPKEPSAANQSWIVATPIPKDICQTFFHESTGSCGYNSICTPLSDGNPSCRCPNGYSLIDPADAYSGCKINFLVGCDSRESQHDEYFMQEIPNTDWPLNDYEMLKNSTLENCKSACLHDCLCAAAIFGANTCWKKKLPLSNGRERQLGTTTFLKLLDHSSTERINPQDGQGGNNRETLVVVVSILLGSSLLVNFMSVGGILTIFFFCYKKKLVGIHQNESSVQNTLQRLTFKEISQATNGFKEELGRGSCGIVYKGELKSAGLIAVKVLDRVFEDGDKEFRAEANVIGQTHHKNLVRLVGYCDENQHNSHHRVLVYEFLRNGTLADFLFGHPKPSWKQRTQIAFGIARGLVYLHEECNTQIIHCDIKPQNILLDDYYNARISDFGLAKSLLINQSHTKTNIRGTKGYVAPDWFRSAPVSVKVDVYSFGVVLLEIICCRRNVDMEVDEEKRILTDWVYDCFLERKLDDLVENDMEAMEDIKMVERFVMVAIWCLHEDPNKRPTMKKVMLMLEGILQVSVPPTPFSFSLLPSAD